MSHQRQYFRGKRNQGNSSPYRERKVVANIRIDIGEVDVVIKPHALDRFDERILGWRYKNSSEKPSKKSKELFKLFHALFDRSEFYAFSAKKNSFVMRAVYHDGKNKKEVFFILNFSQIEGRFEVPTVFSRKKYASRYLQAGKWTVFGEKKEGGD
ncbi:MAG: hypothetical protein HQ536_02675 [Parcubacteria group bacterium]|nr:hypothetical protein [Parcubacteria group bacterium]